MKPSPLLVIKLCASGKQRITLGAGAVTSTLHTHDPKSAVLYNAAIDGMEATLLALHEAGVKLGTPKARGAISDAYYAIDNRHG